MKIRPAWYWHQELLYWIARLDNGALQIRGDAPETGWLSDAAWGRLRFAAFAAALREGQRVIEETRRVDAPDGMHRRKALELCELASRGGPVDAEWEVTRAALGELRLMRQSGAGARALPRLSPAQEALNAAARYALAARPHAPRTQDNLPYSVWATVGYAAMTAGQPTVRPWILVVDSLPQRTIDYPTVERIASRFFLDIAAELVAEHAPNDETAKALLQERGFPALGDYLEERGAEAVGAWLSERGQIGSIVVDVF